VADVSQFINSLSRERGRW